HYHVSDHVDAERGPDAVAVAQSEPQADRDDPRFVLGQDDRAIGIGVRVGVGVGRIVEVGLGGVLDDVDAEHDAHAVALRGDPHRPGEGNDAGVGSRVHVVGLEVQAAVALVDGRGVQVRLGVVGHNVGRRRYADAGLAAVADAA